MLTTGDAPTCSHPRNWSIAPSGDYPTDGYGERSASGAGDAGLLESRGTDAAGPPGGVTDSLAFAVGLRHLDELLLQSRDVFSLTGLVEFVLEVLLLLQKMKPGQRIGRHQFRFD